MGFTAIPSRQDPALLLPTLEMWTRRADAALMLSEVPWDSLLAGVRPDSFVIRNQLGLAQYYRAKRLTIVMSLDPTNGLDRSADSQPLVDAGRSLAEPAIQQLFRDYAVALDTIIRPSALSLASEVNLVRAAAPAALYQAVKQNAADAVTAVRAHDPTVTLFATFQVETAWGGFSGGGYVGIDPELADFSFTQALGLSSYPYFTWVDPDSLPIDYYSRLAPGSPLPVMIIEGGWTSTSLGSITSTPQKQARYIDRHARLLDDVSAAAWFQITFTDLDLSGTPLPPGSILPLFAHLGLVDADLNPKPALFVWDRVFTRPRR